eukprot:7382525-Prymnesium_polylepis.1
MRPPNPDKVRELMAAYSSLDYLMAETLLYFRGDQLKSFMKTIQDPTINNDQKLEAVVCGQRDQHGRESRESEGDSTSTPAHGLDYGADRMRLTLLSFDMRRG